MPAVPKPEHRRSPTFIRAWRRYKELSQEELADRLEIDRTTLGRIEAGKVPYNQDFLERCALALGCEPADLIAVDPLRVEKPREVWDRLRHAPPHVQEQAAAVIEAILKLAS